MIGLSWTAVPACAAQLNGVTFPDRVSAGSAELTLNGVALRTASVLRVPVYVAGLYLEHPSHDADFVVTSSQVKLLRFVFLRDVGQPKVRKTWQRSLAESCVSPCYLSPNDVAQFLGRVPAMHKGDVADVLFTPHGADFTVNSRDLGWVTDPNFARVILLSYIGPAASSPAVRKGILGSP
ncbi:chalcone isomerase family protein [Acidisoma silvae]|uniref:Chalcone isomerase family protein n=1 Tax=Acidisoma silvae TaxID=2802396 RepID=A0A963YUN4_9PROT|nr:chalcone isomerase family protein [Acidisoma silvae]MCB8876867.1 chalcone isomerase family protein [Acidisoma silvae]